MLIAEATKEKMSIEPFLHGVEVTTATTRRVAIDLHPPQQANFSWLTRTHPVFFCGRCFLGFSVEAV